MILLNIFNVIEDILVGGFTVLIIIIIAAIAIPLLIYVLKEVFKSTKKVFESAKEEVKDSKVRRNNIMYKKCYEDVCKCLHNIVEKRADLIKSSAKIYEKTAFEKGFLDHSLEVSESKKTLIKIDSYSIEIADKVAKKKFLYSEYGVDFLYPQEFNEFEKVFIRDLEDYINELNYGCKLSRRSGESCQINYSSEIDKHFGPIAERFNNRKRF